MSLVGRYTTPTHIFTVPFDTGTISMMAVIYKQGGNVLLVKDLEDCTLGDKTVSCTLTEEETSLFKPNPQVQIQLRVGISYTINIQHLLSLVKLLNPRRIHRNVCL